jgi:uncharacterized protein (DUF1499 family)
MDKCTPLTQPVTVDEHVEGSADSPMTLAESADYQCPYCGGAYPIVKRLQKTLGKKQRFVFRHFPVTRSPASLTLSKRTKRNYWRNKMTTKEKYTGKREEEIPPITDGNSGIGLRIEDGQLAPCPKKPNCVSSQAAAGDKKHSIEALTYSDEPTKARERLDEAIAGMKRARVVKREADYWRAEFTSSLWRFVDDVEFLFDDNSRRIDIRSASRVGYGDFGVNRRRMEEIRRRFSVR